MAVVEIVVCEVAKSRLPVCIYERVAVDRMSHVWNCWVTHSGSASCGRGCGTAVRR